MYEGRRITSREEGAARLEVGATGGRLLVLLGPTATGKTETAILVAQALGGEVVSADSMYFYRGMDIATAKPTPEEQRGVPHHLIDILDPDEAFSVAEYKARAEAVIDDILARGRVPILVGGSGLYIRALVTGTGFTTVPPNPELREQLTEEAEREGTEVLHARLAEVDPEAAARITPRDRKRIIRALEVYDATGEPISHLQALDRQRPPRYNTCQFGLTLPREELYRRIEERVDRQLEAGLVEEVRGLLDRGYHEGLTSMKGLGYAQFARYLRGQCSLEEAVVQLKRDTRRFAKRQVTWFRADARIRWLDMQEVGGPAGAARIILDEWNSECE